MGGSQGARSINLNVPNALAALNRSINIKVVHDTGDDDYEEVKESYRRLGIEAKVSKFGFPQFLFLSHMLWIITNFIMHAF